MQVLEKIHKEYNVSKGDLCGIYFDDILHSCTTKEEVDEYIKELIDKWE